MINRYCFTDETASMTLLNEAGYLVQDYTTDEETGEPVADGDPHYPHNMKGAGYDLMVLGVLPDKDNPSDPDEDGNVTYPPLVGWHVDVLSKTVPECLEPFLVHPKNPQHCV